MTDLPKISWGAYNATALEINAYLLRNPEGTLKDASDVLDISYPKARKYLTEFIDQVIKDGLFDGVSDYWKPRNRTGYYNLNTPFREQLFMFQKAADERYGRDSSPELVGGEVDMRVVDEVEIEESIQMAETKAFEVLVIEIQELREELAEFKKIFKAHTHKIFSSIQL